MSNCAGVVDLRSCISIDILPVKLSKLTQHHQYRCCCGKWSIAANAVLTLFLTVLAVQPKDCCTGILLLGLISINIHTLQFLHSAYQVNLTIVLYQSWMRKNFAKQTTAKCNERRQQILFRQQTQLLPTTFLDLSQPLHRYSLISLNN